MNINSYFFGTNLNWIDGFEQDWKMDPKICFFFVMIMTIVLFQINIYIKILILQSKINETIKIVQFSLYLYIKLII